MPVMFVISMAAVMIRPPGVVIGSVIWRTPVIAVAAWVITIISRISVVAVTICGITEADSDSSDSD
jgi:hypothetical protein